MSRALAIVNPVAGGGRAERVWEALAPASVDCVATEARGHARVIAREAVARGIERVVVFGGDGTVSEVAASLARTETALAIVPAGTGNDFSRNLGVPSRARAALRVALDGAVRQVDLGCIVAGGERRPFVNVAGCGFDAEVVRRLDDRRGGRSLAYLIGVLRTLVGFAPRRLRIEVDDHVVERRALGVAVANGPRYGGGLRIAPRALLEDGLLDVCVVGALGSVGILALLPFLYLGAHGRYPGVEFFRGRGARVSGAAHCQADGDLAGELPATFSIEPQALRVVAP